MCSVDFFKIAGRDYDSAIAIWESFRNDEGFINIVAYHLQQSVEKL